MAVRVMSLRYLRWRLATEVLSRTPVLRDHILLYRDVAPASDYAEPTELFESHSLGLSPVERSFAKRLPAGDRKNSIPGVFEQTLRLYQLDGKTLLGNTGVVVDEDARRVIVFPTMRPFINYHYMRPEPLAVRTLPEGRYFNMLGSHKGHTHLFHFMFDRLPKIFHLLERFGQKGSPLTILTNSGLPDFQQRAYGALTKRYPELRFEAVGAQERVRVPTLLTIDDDRNTKSTYADRAVIDFIRETYFEAYGLRAPPTGDRKLYISREDAKKRRLSNDAEIQAFLEARGFETILAAKLPFKEQISLFALASQVAGVHGAGLTNLVFAPPGTRVTEFFPSTKIKNTYFLQARSAGQPYRYAIGSAAGERERFHLPLEKLEEALDGHE